MSKTATQFDAHTIGLEAYYYLYPLVMMEMTRRQSTNVEPGKSPLRAPMNTAAHVPAFPDADFRMVVRPNFDTLYSSIWLDLSDGPIVLSAASTNGRYYLLPIMDMWTDVFASPGWRTSGTDEGHWAIAPPGWTGTVPPGVELISAPTPIVWIIGRTQTNGPADYEAVHAVQQGYTVVPLSAWSNRGHWRPEVPAIDPSIDMATEPMRQVNSMSTFDFFTLAADLLKVHPPHATDWSQLARLRRIGIVPGKSYDPSALSRDDQFALEPVAVEAVAHLGALTKTLARFVNGWSMNTDTMGVYGDFYAKRAAVTMVGLGANQVEDAIYPLQFTDADGNPTDGSNSYVLHFDANELPPVDAFWSVTMYDAEGFQIANPLNRFAIGDRDALQYNADGSLTLLVQAEPPSADSEMNWLPAPTGPFSLCMRLYAPRAAALDGRWNPPGLRRID